MRAFHIGKNGKKTEITEIVTSVTISGEYRSCSRSCSFGIIHGYGDARTWLIAINMGDIIKIIEKDKVLFQGPVWTKRKATDGVTIDFTAQDYGIYLKKNKATYSFTGMTAEAITRKVCTDFGISIGSLASAGTPIDRLFHGCTLYDIIMTAYSIGGGEKKYYAIFEGEQLYVLEKGKKECTPLENGVNLLTSDVSESLESMVNRVRVYNKEDSLLQEFNQAEDSALYGFLTEVIRVSTEDEDFTQKANKTLKGVERKITVTNFGGSEYITGKKVVVKEPYTGLSGVFFIDGDTHNWKNGIYTNKLTLNFENLMDERSAGS